MAQTKKPMDKEHEKQDLMRILRNSADEINEYLPSFRASVDNSGATTQLYVSEK